MARSTFASQNVKKNEVLGPLFEVQMSKNCTPLWREAHVQVKMVKKNEVLGPLFEVQMSKNCTPLWREAHVQVKMLDKLVAPDHFLKFRCRKMARCCGAKHICKSKW